MCFVNCLCVGDVFVIHWYSFWVSFCSGGCVRRFDGKAYVLYSMYLCFLIVRVVLSHGFVGWCWNRYAR